MIMHSCWRYLPKTVHDHETEPREGGAEEGEGASGPGLGGVEGTTEVGASGEVGLGGTDGPVEVEAPNGLGLGEAVGTGEVAAPCGEAGGAEACGWASMPASWRWALVMGVGAPVSGSRPDAALGKAITSRMVGAPARSMHTRSQPNAMPPCGGGPYLNASRRKPNWERASAGERPITLNTACCIADWWIRMDPPPISYPLHTMS